MGNTWQKIMKKFHKDEEIRILMVGKQSIYNYVLCDHSWQLLSITFTHLHHLKGSIVNIQVEQLQLCSVASSVSLNLIAINLYVQVLMLLVKPPLCTSSNQEKLSLPSPLLVSTHASMSARYRSVFKLLLSFIQALMLRLWNTRTLTLQLGMLVDVTKL